MSNASASRTTINLDEQARAARPTDRRVSALDLGELLGISAETVDNFAACYGPETLDPFPAPDGDGRREWAAVRSWILRCNDPLPEPGAEGKRPWSTMNAWLLRNAVNIRRKAPAEGAHGLSHGHRDVLERILVAERAGESIPPLWTEEVLVLEDTNKVALLLKEITAQASQRPRSEPRGETASV
ncbi:hypothetical protein ABR737_00775 [Streptomyces sp. Edi2]|uniref:hypothetical protein n=1 Tax=Streptomyces sp. Edi2 TaxID=3162528 RepID=UPI00330617CC